MERIAKDIRAKLTEAPALNEDGSTNWQKIIDSVADDLGEQIQEIKNHLDKNYDTRIQSLEDSRQDLTRRADDNDIRVEGLE